MFWVFGAGVTSVSGRFPQPIFGGEKGFWVFFLISCENTFTPLNNDNKGVIEK